MVNGKTKKEQVDLQLRLECIMKEGVLLYLEDQLSSPEEIVSRQYVNEEHVYMPDYIISDAGRLMEMRFDKVVQV